MAQWALTGVEGRVVEEMRKLSRQANEWRLEIIGSVSHGQVVISLRPTPYLRIEPKEPLSLAVDD